MRLTYTDIKNQFLRNIGLSGSTDTQILADFDLNLSQRYQMIMSRLTNYVTQEPFTFTTVADTQFYDFPVNIANIESAVITIGSIDYPLEVINSQRQWDILNAVSIQATAIPQFIFPRKSDFGIWPTPQDAYTGTLNYHYRDRSLSIADYTEGTIAATASDATITGSGTTFTSGMVGLWLSVTDTTISGWGYWYRVDSFTSTTSIELDRGWQSSTMSGAAYRIGQTPEIPEEGHITLVNGVTADYYMGLRSDIKTATWYNNLFWTGDGNNNSRRTGDQSVAGGLIGLINTYADRNREVLITRKPYRSDLQSKAFAMSITPE